MSVQHRRRLSAKTAKCWRETAFSIPGNAHIWSASRGFWLHFRSKTGRSYGQITAFIVRVAVADGPKFGQSSVFCRRNASYLGYQVEYAHKVVIVVEFYLYPALVTLTGDLDLRAEESAELVLDVREVWVGMSMTLCCT